MTALKVWPTAIQNKLQAMFDADDGIGRAGYERFLPVDIEGEPRLFCGECGQIGATNPDNDICSACERKLGMTVTQ